ncbi:hypothetical protein GC197_05285 [bacterium]|nr:hypothetical protein [bacterium]
MENMPESQPEKLIVEPPVAEVVDENPQVGTPPVKSLFSPMPPKPPRHRKPSISIAGAFCLGIGGFQILGSLLMQWVIRELSAVVTTRADETTLENVSLFYWGYCLFGIFLCLVGSRMQYRESVYFKLGLLLTLSQIVATGWLLYRTGNLVLIIPTVLSSIVALAILIEWSHVNTQERLARYARRPSEKRNESTT